MSFYKNSFKDIILEVHGHVLMIALNNQALSNAFSDDMIQSLCQVLNHANYDESVRVIILTGEGKNFCAGGDVKAMKDRSGMFSGSSIDLRERYASGIQQIPRTIESLKKPIIAMVNGSAIGAGCDLSAMCDLRVCADNSKFGETFTKLALVPGDGGPYFLARVIGYARAMEMYLTGDLYDSSWALKSGLVSSVFSAENLKEETLKLAYKIAANSPVAIEFTKMAMKRAQKDDIDSHLNFVSLAQAVTQRSNDHDRAITALLDKSAAKFERD